MINRNLSSLFFFVKIGKFEDKYIFTSSLNRLMEVGYCLYEKYEHLLYYANEYMKYHIPELRRKI